jgi:hypothetical protein
MAGPIGGRVDYIPRNTLKRKVSGCFSRKNLPGRSINMQRTESLYIPDQRKVILEPDETPSQDLLALSWQDIQKKGTMEKQRNDENSQDYLIATYWG